MDTVCFLDPGVAIEGFRDDRRGLVIEQAHAIHQRSDVCAVPAAGVVVEAMVALVLARAALEKFGGDSLAETRRNIGGYLREIAERESFGSPSVRLSG
jgi:chorismate synthase